MTSLYARHVKRIFDIAAAIAAIVILSPLLVMTAVAIRLTDSGPLIFRQQRVGRDGRLFTFYKFRSMPVGTANVPSDAVGEIKIRPVGRFIRRTNVDELPQLFNVLLGTMSIVGPRPPLPSQEELIGRRRKNGALSCRPGLTGLAQVNSYDGMSVEEKARLDGEYRKRLSFVTDVSIILKTFKYLLKPPPRY